MRPLSLLCASIAAVLLYPATASATCEAPSVSWSKFPSEQQCVTGVIKYVKAEWNLTFPATGGHATKDGCHSLGACIEWVYDLPSSSEWNKHKWGSVKAQAKDIAVFPPASGDAYGHIAMIDHVSGSTLWLMDDNWEGLHEKSCAWAGHSGWVHSTTWEPYGFFRLKKLEPWRAEFESQSWPTAKDAPEVLTVGEVKTGWIKLKNTGTETWKAGVVKLAPIPRDKTSDLEASTWLSSKRVSTVTADVKTGETGTFEWDLTGSKTGHTEPYFGLVAEGHAWFADEGGPSDKTIRVNVTVVDAPDAGTVADAGGGGAGGAGGAADAGGGTGGAGGIGGAGGGSRGPGGSWGEAGPQQNAQSGCAMSERPGEGGSAAGLALALAFVLRRRVARRRG